MFYIGKFNKICVIKEIFKVYVIFKVRKANDLQWHVIKQDINFRFNF